MPMDADKEKLLLESARELHSLMPSLDRGDALFAVGMDEKDANNPKRRLKLKSLIEASQQQHGRIQLGTGDAELVARSARIFALMKQDPNKRKGGVFLTDALKYAGCDDSVCRSGHPIYQQARRLWKKDQEKNQRPASSVNLSVSHGVCHDPPPALSPLTADGFSLFGGDSVSTTATPASSSSSSGSTPQIFEKIFQPDDFDNNAFFWPVTYPNDNEENDASTISLPSRAKPQSLQHLTSSKNSRQTTQAAQQERRLIAEGRDIKRAMFKAATVVWQGVVSNANALKIFDSPNKVASEFNKMCGLELFSGNELKTAVDLGNAGKSPPRKGRCSTVEDTTFQAFCDAVFTHSAIQQINGGTRATRSELLSLVGEILNAKRSDDGDDPLGETFFFRRIEEANARRQSFATLDKRESIRVTWLTYLTQKLNYQRFEETVVSLGFGRRPREGEETTDHVVWLEGQEFRVINLDEMSLSLDASSTRGGGRPSATPAADGVSGEGSGAQKSSDKVTVVYGMNFGNEALPPYILFPTNAKSEDRYKLQAMILPGMRQVKGQFGFPGERVFDPGMAMNPKGGMNTVAFHKYCVEFIMRLYPDAEDVPGRRVLIKIDSGPGRFNPELQYRLRLRGFYMFPGVPNGTEVGQEMDQLYSYAKTICYRNRDRLSKARSALNPEATSTLGFGDVSCIVFGGLVRLGNGEAIELEEAFNMAFDAAHLQRAKEKCGYYPSTRAALKNPKVRHEVVHGNENSEDDSCSDPIGALQETIEVANGEACDRLIENGYTLASKLKVMLRKVEVNQVAGRTRVLTEPNTKERQELLAKVSTAGQFFHVTNGGGPMNSNDALLGYASKTMAVKAKKLEKKKAALKTFAVIERDAKRILETDKWSVWKKDDIKTVISFKQGPFPKDPFDDKVSGLNKTKLKELYESKYLDLNGPAKAATWTDELEEKLQMLKKGEWGDLFVEKGLKKALDRDDEEIVMRLESSMPQRRRRVIASVFKSLDKEERKGLHDDLAAIVGEEDENE